jgi:TolB-like protein
LPSEAAFAGQAAGRRVPVAPEDLQGELDRMVLTALDKDPRRRFASVAELSENLQRLAPPGSTATRPQGVVARVAGTVRRHRVATTVAAAIALGLVLIQSPLFNNQRPPATPAPGGKIMLAVLPLENLTGTDEQQPFADGLHEEIVSRLGRLQPERLGVIARTSVLQYQGTRKSISDIGHELGVQYVLEGSVQQWGPRVRVTAQFIEVRDQTHLWAETFDRDIGDLFRIQTEIGGHVADSLQLAVLPAARAAVDRPGYLPSDAYTEYLRGKYYWHRRWLGYPANAQQALDRFLAVVAAAPDYAEGHAALGQTYQYLSIAPALRTEHQQLLDQARGALSRALTIDPQQASALATQAWIAFRNDWDWRLAERGFDEALRHDPNNPDIHQQLATLLAYSGRHLEADREIRAAQQLDPLSPTLHVSAFYVHLVGRRWDMAEQTAGKVAELVPGGSIHVYFASLIHALRGRCETALQMLSTLEHPASAPEGGTLGEEHNGGFVLGRCGRVEDATRLVRALEQRPDYLAQRIAVIYAGLGDSTRALQWLEESLRRQEDVVTSVPTDPRFEALAAEPRFQRVIEQLALPNRR